MSSSILSSTRICIEMVPSYDVVELLRLMNSFCERPEENPGYVAGSEEFKRLILYLARTVPEMVVDVLKEAAVIAGGENSAEKRKVNSKDSCKPSKKRKKGKDVPSNQEKKSPHGERTEQAQDAGDFRGDQDDNNNDISAESATQASESALILDLTKVDVEIEIVRKQPSTQK